MAVSPTYAQLLRPIGQALDGLGADSFRLEVDRNDFVVRGKTTAKTVKPAPNKPKSLRVVWEMIRGARPPETAAGGPSSGVFELSYTPEDLAHLDLEGKSQRQNAALTPEAHSLSQILRAVGAFVDEKGGRLLAVIKQDQTIFIEYESALKRKTSDQLTVSVLYDYWVRMYLKRRNRLASRD